MTKTKKSIKVTDYREFSSEFNRVKREARSVSIESFRSANKEVNNNICTQQEFETARTLLHEKHITLVSLYKKLIDIKKEIANIGDDSEYVDVTATCSICGKTINRLENLYVGFDFKRAQCDQCRLSKDNQTEVDLIKNGKNFKPIFNDEGSIVTISFDCHGKKYEIYNDLDERYGELTIHPE